MPKEYNKKEQIQKTLADLAKFPEMNPGPVLRIDRKADILLANSAALNVFRQENLVGMNWLDLCPQISKDSWKEILNCKDVYPVEIEVNEKCLLLNHVCTDDMEHVFVFGADITDNKLNERKLSEQAAELAEIARFPDMNPGPVLRMDFNGVIILSNTAASNLFGGNLEGKCWFKICPGIGEDTWEEIIDSESIFPIEVRISDKDYVFKHRRDKKLNLVFVFGTDVTFQKAAEKSLRQSEKLATLGTLAAGVAHELNNPAAATKRAGEQLNNVYLNFINRIGYLNSVSLTNEEFSHVTSMINGASLNHEVINNIGVMEHSDNEAEIEEWLEKKAVAEPWRIASVLNNNGIKVSDLKDLSSKIKPASFNLAAEWIADNLLFRSLLYNIVEGSGRISEIVSALKNYTYLGQAPIQQVNIHEGINNTLIILNNKIKAGIKVNREYCSDIPLITAFGSELNQVWTNILDNAIGAMNGNGEITIRTEYDKDYVTAEIEDNGPGIPAENLSRIFDPFFTTKEPGKGTGLGLSNCYSIVTQKHQGTLSVKSKPGSTIFIVKLPIMHGNS